MTIMNTDTGAVVRRGDLRAAFPGCKITVRQVSFMDLARGGAYVLRIEGVNDLSIMSPREAAMRAPHVARLRALVGNRPTVNGLHLLTSLATLEVPHAVEAIAAMRGQA